MELAHHFSLTKNLSKLHTVFVVIALSLFFALISSISIRIPFTPVPVHFTGQCVLLFSVLLGRRATYATLLYLGEGLIGLPVFSNGGFGLMHLLGPTGGYLIGYAIASYVVATLSEKLEAKTPVKIFGILLLGNALLYVFGLPVLGIYVGSSLALKCGFYPFIATDLLKLIVGQRALKALKFFK